MIKNKHGRDLSSNLVKNVVASIRKPFEASRDAERLVSELERRLLDDPNGFFKVLLHEDNLLKSIFWMSGKQRELCNLWGSVMMNDNTCKSNQYGLPLNLSMVIDGDGHARSVCFSLLSDETTDSYVWMLQCYKEAVARPLQVVYSDADPAMIAAMEQVFPDAAHHLCQWHLNQNILKNLAGALGAKFNAFNAQYHRARKAFTVNHFEESVEALLCAFPEARSYFEGYLLPKKQMWASAYVNRYFLAGICSTSR